MNLDTMGRRWGQPLLIAGLAALGIGALSQTTVRHVAPERAPAATHRSHAAAADPLADPLTRVLYVARKVRRAAIDPDSFAALAATSNADASEICLRYRARNRLGAMTVEAVRVKGGQVQRVASWHRECERAGWRAWPV